MNNLQEIPKCICGEDLKIKRYNSGFQAFCSTLCSNKVKAQNQDKDKFLVKKIYFNKNDITKELLEKYINVYNCVDTNFYKMCDFKISSEEVYLIYNELKEPPKCINCNNTSIFVNFRDGYRKHCSLECSYKSEDRTRKIIEASLIKDENGLNSYDKMTIKMRITNENNGNWLPLSEYTNFQLYYRMVLKFQYKFKEEIKKLENFDKRGHANKGMYHLDHKFSIYEGFKQNIPPYIIGNICNLEMIIGRNNLSKNRKCSITKEELFKSFFS